MEKLILVNKSDLSMVDFMSLAKAVISSGLVSNNETQYTYSSSFKIYDDKHNLNEYRIVSDKNKNSHKLTFYKI